MTKRRLNVGGLCKTGWEGLESGIERIGSDVWWWKLTMDNSEWLVTD